MRRTVSYRVTRTRRRFASWSATKLSLLVFNYSTSIILLRSLILSRGAFPIEQVPNAHARTSGSSSTKRKKNSYVAWCFQSPYPICHCAPLFIRMLGLVTNMDAILGLTCQHWNFPSFWKWVIFLLYSFVLKHQYGWPSWKRKQKITGKIWELISIFNY